MFWPFEKTSTLFSLIKLQYLSIVWFITSLGIRKFDCCSQRVLSPCWPGRWCISPPFSPFLRSSATKGPTYFWSCVLLLLPPAISRDIFLCSNHLQYEKLWILLSSGSDAEIKVNLSLVGPFSPRPFEFDCRRDSESFYFCNSLITTK